MAELVHCTVADHVALITLDHPPVNAISSELGVAFRALLADLDSDSQVRAAVLTGGPQHFSGGFDINELRVSGPEDAVTRNRRILAAYGAAEEVRFPVIAAINGYAVGGSCEMALACDYRVMAADAFLSWPEVDLAGMAHLQRLTRMIGRAATRRLVYRGEKCSADEAHRLGLVEVIADAGRATEHALAEASLLASKPPHVIEALKRATAFGPEVPLPAAISAELSIVGEVATGPGRYESLKSFTGSGD